MNLTSAYLLVSHGSRDPRPQIALERLAYLTSQRLAIRGLEISETKAQSAQLNSSFASTATLLRYQDQYWVKTATLECHDLPLHQQIIDAACSAKAAGFSCLKIVPLFLLSGVHVQDDLPAQIAIAEQYLGQEMKLSLSPYLGSSVRLANLIAQQFNQYPTDGRIILAHGSRRSGGNDPIEQLAVQFNAIACYWSVPPHLETVINNFQSLHQSLYILPYFLFTGGITDAIAQQVGQLQQHYPQIQFKIGFPLGATPELAQVIIDLIHP
ncbi:MAG: sirohydrochlorin chelatase [Snowella sp.]|nr:sirohydrochlorin chelatase [Snowella sp.]